MPADFGDSYFRNERDNHRRVFLMTRAHGPQQNVKGFHASALFAGAISPK